jgi:hypothetical protein
MGRVLRGIAKRLGGGGDLRYGRLKPEHTGRDEQDHSAGLMPLS